MRINAVSQNLAILGQHVRVGNEDNLWNSKRERVTTVQQIEAMVRNSEAFTQGSDSGGSAQDHENRGHLQQRGGDAEELGMPLNRGADDRGFMVWETDGKKSVQHAISDSHPMAYCMVPPPLTEPKKAKAA
jgi:hypothetical protein